MQNQDHLNHIEDIAENIMYVFIKDKLINDPNKKLSIADAEEIHTMIVSNADVKNLSITQRALFITNCMAEIQSSTLKVTETLAHNIEDKIMRLGQEHRAEERKAQEAKAKPETP